jgi:CO/xanthine dehydrogenase Mo-binding subunit
VPAAHCRVTGVHTNKAPGGVAYACSFRVTEASYLVERLVDVLAFDLGLDPAELRMRNLLRPEQFPYRCATGWEYDSGDYPRTLALALEKVATRSCARSRRPAARPGTGRSSASVSASSPRRWGPGRGR